MRDEDKLMKCDAEKIIELTEKTYEKNLLKFVVLFGEDDYFLGTMRNGDEGYGKTIDTLVRKTDKSLRLRGILRVQDNSAYFYGVFLTKRENGVTSIKLEMHMPGDSYITYGEHRSFKRFAEENKGLVGSEKCDISLDGKGVGFDELKNEIACSINPKKEGKIFFSSVNLPLIMR